VSITAHSEGECDRPYHSPIYDALIICEKMKLSQSQAEIKKFQEKMSAAHFCADNALTNAEEKSIHDQLCSNPAEYACKKDFTYLDQDCHFLPSTFAQAQETPSFRAAKCLAERKVKLYKMSAVPSLMNYSFMALYHTHELNQAIFDAFYTKERIKIATDAFNKVKSKYLEMIAQSKTIPENQKSYLAKRIMVTHLDLSGDLTKLASDHPDCYIKTDPPSTDIAMVSNDDGSGNTVHLCLGAVANIENTNINDLYLTFGHEISHSFDPCMIDRLNSETHPHISETIFPGLMKCLLGNKNSTSCGTGTVLHCNTPAGIKTYCEENNKGKPADYEKCMDIANKTPHCPWGKRDPEYNENDINDYKKNGPPVAQIQESFADYMGAEVTGKILADQPPTLRDQNNLLTAISSDFSSIHGRCLNQNTIDPHPPGYIRVNRTIMSSPDFLAGAGCSHPPQTQFSGQKCEGI